MEAVTCPQCGAENDATAIACKQCGASFAEVLSGANKADLEGAEATQRADGVPPPPSKAQPTRGKAANVFGKSFLLGLLGLLAGYGFFLIYYMLAPVASADADGMQTTGGCVAMVTGIVFFAAGYWYYTRKG